MRWNTPPEQEMGFSSPEGGGEGRERREERERFCDKREKREERQERGDYLLLACGEGVGHVGVIRMREHAANSLPLVQSIFI